MYIHTEAIVLKSFSYKETSLIAYCFSKDNGKIPLIVKGAKSKRSPKYAQFQPLSYIEIVYNSKPTRELQVLSKVNFKESWPRITEDLKTITLAMVILELTEKIISIEDPFPKLFETLTEVLRLMNKRELDPSLLFWFYECALLNHSGFRPRIHGHDLPGISLPNPKDGENSFDILSVLLQENICDLNNLGAISFKDKKLISNYLWTLLRYHFDSISRIKSISTIKKILRD